MRAFDGSSAASAHSAVALLLATLTLAGCAVHRAPPVEQAGRLAAVADLALAHDALNNPRAQADPEVRRLTAVHDALQIRLRATEDELLLVVIKSADYDEQAAEQVRSLQQSRLLLTLALRDIEQQRRERAEDAVAGLPLAEAAVDRPTVAQDGMPTGKLEAEKQQANDEDPLAPLLARAATRLQQLRRDAAGGWGKRHGYYDQRFSGQLGMAGRYSGGPRRGERGPAGVTATLPHFKPDPAPPVDDPREEFPDEGNDVVLLEVEGKEQSGTVQAAAVVAGDTTPDLGPALRPFLPRMQACIPSEQLRQGLSFTLRARLGPDGSVRGARLSAGHGLPASAAACVVDVMTQVRVPEGAGGRIVSVPMQISARQ